MDIRQISSSPPVNYTSAAPVAHDAPAVADSQVAAVPVATVAAVRQVAQVPTLEQVTQAVQTINKSLQAEGRGLEFAVDHDSTNGVVIKVVDQKTKEVVRQIPSEETLQIAKSLDNATGLLIQQSA